MQRYEAVVLGGSSGGLEALTQILRSLPAGFPLPLIVAQHLHPLQDATFCSRLNADTPLIVKEAEEKERVVAGNVYFAPPNYHLLLEKNRTFSLSVDERVHYSRPAIDVLFESAAEVYRAGLIGVILSGANQDGAQGLKRIKAYGGLAIVQDPATAQTGYMPAAAIAAVAADYILPVAEIGPFLRGLVSL